MKKIHAFLFVLTFLCMVVHGQRKTFMRLYDLNSHNFTKGYFVGTTDSSINIYRHGNTIAISASAIGSIKTKRSFGHTLLLTDLAITIPFTLLGVAFDVANESQGVFSVTGFLLGNLLGLPSGALLAGAKSSATFVITGNPDAWRRQKTIIDLLPARR